MINNLLEYLHNPQWLRFVFLLAVFVLLVDGYILPFVYKQKNKLASNLDRSQIDHAMVRLSWSRGASNFYFVISLLGIGLTYSSYAPSPDFRIMLNIIIAASILYAFENFRRALKIRKSLCL